MAVSAHRQERSLWVSNVARRLGKLGKECYEGKGREVWMSQGSSGCRLRSLWSFLILPATVMAVGFPKAKVLTLVSPL